MSKLTEQEIKEFDRRVNEIGEEMQAYVEAAHESTDPKERAEYIKLAGQCVPRLRRVAKDIVSERNTAPPE